MEAPPGRTQRRARVATGELLNQTQQLASKEILLEQLEVAEMSRSGKGAGKSLASYLISEQHRPDQRHVAKQRTKTKVRMTPVDERLSAERLNRRRQSQHIAAQRSSQITKALEQQDRVYSGGATAWYKTQPCRYLARGEECRNGDWCRYSHAVPAKLQSPAPPPAKASKLPSPSGSSSGPSTVPVQAFGAERPPPEQAKLIAQEIAQQGEKMERLRRRQTTANLVQPPHSARAEPLHEMLHQVVTAIAGKEEATEDDADHVSRVASTVTPERGPNDDSDYEVEEAEPPEPDDDFDDDTLTKQSSKRSELRKAAIAGDVQAVTQQLEEFQVAADELDDRAETALMNAAECGHVAVVRILLDNGADVFRSSKAGDTALSLVIKHIDWYPDEAVQSDVVIELVREAIRKAGLPKHDDAEDWFSRLHALARTEYPFSVFRPGQPIIEVAVWLAMFGVNAEMEMEYRYTPFVLACEQQRVDVVKLLLKIGCNTDAQNYLGYTGWDCAELCRVTPQDRTDVEAVLEATARSPVPPSDQGNEVDETTWLALREEQHRRHIRPERWKHKVSERFVRKFLPYPTQVHDIAEVFADKTDWRPLQQGAYGTLWRRDNLSPPIHVRGQPPVSEAVVKAVRYTVAETGGAVGSLLRLQHTDSRAFEGTEARESPGSASELALRSEINTLAALAELQHENLVLTYGIEFGATPDTAGKESFMLLLELCSYDLGNLIYGKKHTPGDTMGGQSWTEICLKISQQMAAGLKFIQSDEVGELFPRNTDGTPRKICHLDLKPGNVLIKESASGLTAKIADFGMSVGEGRHPYGTFEYMPPECWQAKYGTPDQTSDVFSFGILLWEMFARHRVYTGLGNLQEVASAGVVDVELVPVWMTVSRRRPEFLASCPCAWRLLCEACWVLPPPPAPDTAAEQESADEIVARHQQAMDARPSFSQISEVLRRIEQVDDWDLPPPTSSEDPFQAFVAQLGMDLEQKLSAFRDLLTVGSELVELKQMDEDDLKEDILDDDALALTEAEKAQFMNAVLELKVEVPPDQYQNEAWEQLLQLLGAQHAVQLQRPGVWLSVDELLQKAEDGVAAKQAELVEKDRLIQSLRAELAVALDQSSRGSV